MAKYSISDLATLAAYGLCRILPINWVSALGAWRGRYHGKTLAELESRVRGNLAEIAPDIDPEVVLPALRREAGRAELEVLISDRLVQAGRMEWPPHPELDQAIAAQRSIVFALIHVSNLGDVLGGAIANRYPHFKTRDVVVRKIHNPVVRSIVERCRARLRHDMPGDTQAPEEGLARRVLSNLLSAPAMLILHVDEARSHQVPFPAFGASLPAKGLNAHYAVRFARRAGACLVPIVLHRQKDDPTSFSTEVLAVWDMATEASADAEMLDRMGTAFEKVILKDPAKWLNLYHRRPSAAQPSNLP